MLLHRRALVVEDDTEYWDKAQLILPDWSLKCVGSVREAQDEFDKDPTYDLLVVDYRLPDYDGTIFLDAVRAKDEHIPILLFSEYANGSGYDLNAQRRYRALAPFVDKSYFESDSQIAALVLETRGNYDRYMEDRFAPRIYDEYGKLQSVLVHTPAEEIEYIDTEERDWYLFDGGPPDLLIARAQHAAFTRKLKERGQGALIQDVALLLREVVQVASAEDRVGILKRTLLPPEVRLQQTLLNRVGSRPFSALLDQLFQEIADHDADVIVRTILCGLTVDDFSKSLGYRDESGSHSHKHRQVVPPVPNLYFMRDPAFVLGEALVLSKMHWDIRRREPSILREVVTRHPFMKRVMEKMLDMDAEPGAFSIEGGDCMAIQEGHYVIAESERTSRRAIKIVARHLFEKCGAKRILQPFIPARRSFIHLDTVCSLVGADHVLVHPQAMSAYEETLEWTPDTLERDGEPLPLRRSLLDILQQEYGKEVLKTAGGDPMAEHEQWNDATNTFMANPTVAIVYDRNKKTNAQLKEAVDSEEFTGDDLVLGRGGPRCMTMPLRRL